MNSKHKQGTQKRMTQEKTIELSSIRVNDETIKLEKVDFRRKMCCHCRRSAKIRVKEKASEIFFQARIDAFQYIRASPPEWKVHFMKKFSNSKVDSHDDKNYDVGYCTKRKVNSKPSHRFAILKTIAG
jgi:hypothetical protein